MVATFKLREKGGSVTSEPGGLDERPTPAPPPGGVNPVPKPPPGAQVAMTSPVRVLSREVLNSQSGVVLILGIASVLLASACGIGVVLAMVAIIMALFISDGDREDPSKKRARRLGLTLSIVSLVVGGVFLIGFASSFA